MKVNHSKKALSTFQKHLPKLHLTHKSLKLDSRRIVFIQFASSHTKTKTITKQKVGCRLGDLATKIKNVSQDAPKQTSK
jgi:hypothetical protein